jgi:hypothetical protein
MIQRTNQIELDSTPDKSPLDSPSLSQRDEIQEDGLHFSMVSYDPYWLAQAAGAEACA